MYACVLEEAKNRSVPLSRWRKGVRGTSNQNARYNSTTNEQNISDQHHRHSDSDGEEQLESSTVHAPVSSLRCRVHSLFQL